MVSFTEGNKREVTDLQPDEDEKSGGGALWLGMQTGDSLRFYSTQGQTDV